MFQCRERSYIDGHDAFIQQTSHKDHSLMRQIVSEARRLADACRNVAQSIALEEPDKEGIRLDRKMTLTYIFGGEILDDDVHGDLALRLWKGHVERVEGRKHDGLLDGKQRLALRDGTVCKSESPSARRSKHWRDNSDCASCTRSTTLLRWLGSAKKRRRQGRNIEWHRSEWLRLKKIETCQHRVLCSALLPVSEERVSTDEGVREKGQRTRGNHVATHQ